MHQIRAFEPDRPQGKIALGAIMRNEGISVLEWVAYHLGIGFEQIFVYTNDCEDGTDAILARLAELLPGQIFHFDESVPKGLSVHDIQYAKMRALPQMREVDYLAILDADEYMVVTLGEGRVQDLLASLDTPDCIALMWRHFGDSGMKKWSHGRLLTRQVHCEKTANYPMHKSMFRPLSFDAYSPHHPNLSLIDAPKITNSCGQPLQFQSGGQRFEKIEASSFTWQNACIHHYAFKAQDIFLLKNHRGDSHALVTNKYKRGSTFQARVNRNRVRNTSAIAHDERTLAYLDRFFADPELARLHKAAEDWIDDAVVRILTPERIWAWTHPTEQKRLSALASSTSAAAPSE